jgi:hypothetical protein
VRQCDPFVLWSHIGIIAYGISTGVALWRTTKGAVKNVRIFLIVNLAVAAVPLVLLVALGSE